MNELLKEIRDMLSAEILGSSPNSHAIIQESKNNPKENEDCLKKITISVDEEFKDWFAFSPDDFLNGKNKGKVKKHSLFPLLKHDGDYQKTCDCVIALLDKKDILQLVFIEIKNSTDRSKKIAKIQLINTHNFFENALELKLKHLELSFDCANGDEKNKLEKLKRNLENMFHNKKCSLVVITADQRKPLINQSSDEKKIRIIYNVRNGDTKNLKSLIRFK